MKLPGHSKTLCLVVLFCGQTLSLTTQSHPATQLNIDAEEYAVYGRLIKTVYHDNVPEGQRIHLLVLLEDTSLQERVANDLDRAFVRWKDDVGFLQQETLDDLKKKNKQPHQLRSVFDIPMTYVIVNRQELKKAVGEGDQAGGWARFYKAYPNSSGLVGLSRVGFNREMNQALVYVERSCGDMCAYGRVIFLTRETHGWIVQKIFDMWVV